MRRPIPARKQKRFLPPTPHVKSGEPATGAEASPFNACHSDVFALILASNAGSRFAGTSMPPRFWLNIASYASIAAARFSADKMAAPCVADLGVMNATGIQTTRI